MTIDCNFKEILDEHFGSARQFGRKCKLSNPTALRYYNAPETMPYHIKQKLRAFVGGTLVIKIVGEGDE